MSYDYEPADLGGAGRMFAVTQCWVHKGVFECNPDTVVTVWITPDGHVADRDADGARQVAICDPCMELVNEDRAAKGLEPFTLAREVRP